MARRRKGRKASERKADNELVDWFFMRPCMGVVNVTPPLCTWTQVQDGTYSITDIMRFNIAIDERIQKIEAMQNG